MALGTALTIIIYILIIFVVFKLVKKIAKAFFYMGLITLLIFLIFGFFILKDINDFKNNFTQKGSMVILEENGNVLSGYTLEQDSKFLTSEEISKYSGFLQKKDYESILKDKFKLMIISLDLVSGLESERISLGDTSIKKESMIDILKSDDPFEVYNKALVENESFGQKFDSKTNDDNSEFKAALLGNIVNEELIGPENAVNFFSQYKKGNVIIYPETALFKFVKLIPTGLIKTIAKSAFVKANEITGDVVEKIENLL